MPLQPFLPLVSRAVAAAFLALLALSAGALPPQVEADRQLKAAASEMRQDTIAWPRVLEALNAAEATGAKLPENFDYYMGMALSETGEPAQAVKRLTRYLERYGKRARSYDAALEQLNLAEKRQAQKLEAEQRARQAEEDRLAAEAKAKQAQEEIARSWERQYFRYWIMDTEGSGTCSKARDRISSFVRSNAVRDFDCRCSTEDVGHPAWRDHTNDVCRGSFEINWKLDTSAELKDRAVSNKWGIRFQDDPFKF